MKGTIFARASSSRSKTTEPRQGCTAWVAILALAVTLGFSQTSAAQVTSVNGKIAYVACELGSFPDFIDQCDIWVMNPDSTEQTNITNTPNLNEVNPAWSADGTKIAFIEGFNGVNYLKVIDLGVDGTGRTVTTITPTPSYQFGPSWSPDGTQIALVRQLPGQVMSIQFDIVVVNVDGLGELNLTNNSDFDELDPAWSPDGTKIAFAGVRFEDYIDPGTGNTVSGAQWQIVTVNPDGTGEQVLTVGEPGSPRAQYLEEDRGPAWSPDSSKIVFMSQDQIPACCGPWQIWAVNRDGTGATNLTDDVTAQDLFPSYSPDGTLILFSRANGIGGFDLYTMPAPTTLPPPALAGTATSRAATVTRLTTTGNASDANWGRDPQSGTATEYTLSVTIVSLVRRAGGSVISAPKGIKCGRDCSEVYAAGKVVTLTATPKLGSIFSGWTGACASFVGTTCTVTMDAVKSVGAQFSR